MNNRPLRSLLYMPASNERALAKAENLPADGLILDLEDATVVAQKDNARASLAEKLATKPYGKKLVIVRVNDTSTPWYKADLQMAIRANVDVILLPKINTAAEVKAVLNDMKNAPKHIQLWLMIETPLALMNINEIAALATGSRLSGLVMGTNDLAKDMQIPLPTYEQPERLGFTSYFSSVILAAKAFGLVALDGVFNNFNDVDGLAFEANQAKQLGFDGKTLIHPKQLDVVNEIFAASDAELAFARKVVAAFDLPENAELGAITVDGKMAERLHADMARALLAKAEYYE
ncbi:MAG: CoA ester lyase [Rhizobiales bacterium]|nr:CoA ester lyase [Hyphomicrobiales bacterium]NRB14637.1 CoA ester lyase [Hyphomicrobiales bacterium]